MKKQEILKAILDLEKTIKQNFWQKGYIQNCKNQISSYTARLAELESNG